MNLKQRIARAALGLAVGSLAGTAGCVGGGCPWTHASAVTVEPATSCLSAEVLNASGNGPGGCVSPSLQVTNACSEAVTVPGVLLLVEGDGGFTTSGESDATVTIDPGTTASFEIARPASDTVSVSASLGSQPVAFDFTVSGGP